MNMTVAANIKQNVLRASAVFLSVLAVLVGPTVGTANAQAVAQDTVAITHSTFGCGAANLTFSGTAGFISNLPHRIIVKLDGVEIYTDDSKPTSWTTPAVAVSVGAHTLTTEVWDLDGNNNLDSIDDDDSWDFTIDACPTATPTPTPTATPTPDGSGGGAGDEQDCCPGRDPEPENNGGGQVLGTSTKKVVAKATPTPQVAGTTVTFKAPATGMSALPSVAFAVISSGAAVLLQKKRG